MTLLAFLLAGSLGAATLHGGPPVDRPIDSPADTVSTADAPHRLLLLGGVDAERVRLAHLLGEAPSRGFLLRSPSSLDGPEEDDAFRWAPIAPELYTIRNSALPFSLNEGPLWAGRGLGTRMTAGARASWRGVTLVLAPQLVYEENRGFQTITRPDPERQLRDPLASPFHFPPGSMDLPQRFGESARTLLDPGQSSLTVRRGPVAFGAATENLWWGPGIRNAILMSSNAPGVPHLFVGTAEPVETRVGAVDARWMVGRLSESDYFEPGPAGDPRSLSAFAVTFSPDFEPDLSVGFARAVYAPAEGGGDVLRSALDAFRGVGRPDHAPGDTLVAPGRDQLFTLFARWVFPEVGFEAYGEWGRHEQPKNVRDFLELPNHTRGYTVGLQFARPAGSLGTFRLQSEVTNLEPSTSYRVRPFGEWYASRSVKQGYTHHGRVIGAAIGPSGSGQWLAGDLFGSDWHAGAFLGRIRWENQARFTFFPEFRRSDVSLFAGARGGIDLGPVRIFAEYARTARLNYLFQAEPVGPGGDRGVDIINHTLKVTLSTGSGLSLPGFLP